MIERYIATIFLLLRDVFTFTDKTAEPIKIPLSKQFRQFQRLHTNMALSKLNPQDRFMDINDETLAEKHLHVQKKNTKKNDKAAERQFRDYLSLKDCDHTCFWDFEAHTLDDHLSKFWFSTRQNKIDEATKEPKKYRVQTMKTMRYALNRVLREHGTSFDIITDPAFRKSQIAFSDCCKELKEEGFGYIKPTDEIIPEG